MFQGGTVPFVAKRCFIKRIENRIPKSCVVLWCKRLPEAPSTHRCDVVSDNLAIIIPQIDRPGDLYGTHLEVRLMDPGERCCLCRFCAWLYGGKLHLATPNDSRRDIDNLDRDLWSTKRCYGFRPGPLTLRLRRVEGHYFAAFGEGVLFLSLIHI